MIDNKVVILDDHPIYFVGLKFIINNEHDFTVTDCCKNSDELFFSLSLAPAHIAIIDCSRPREDLSLARLVEQLQNLHPTMAIIVMGESQFHKRQCSALKSRIKSYFCKSFPPENIINALRNVMFIYRYGESSDTKNVVMTGNDYGKRLSHKEKIVIEYLQAGLTVSQTATRLSRSVKTISSQKRSAMRKLGLSCEREIFKICMNDL